MPPPLRPVPELIDEFTPEIRERYLAELVRLNERYLQVAESLRDVRVETKNTVSEFKSEVKQDIKQMTDAVSLLNDKLTRTDRDNPGIFLRIERVEQDLKDVRERESHSVEGRKWWFRIAITTTLTAIGSVAATIFTVVWHYLTKP